MKPLGRVFVKIIAFVPVILVIVLVIIFYKRLAHVIIPIILGLILSYMMEPLVYMWQRMRISRTISIILSFLMVFIFITILIIFIAPSFVKNLKDIIESLPKIQSDYRKLIDDVFSIVRSKNLSDGLKNSLTEVLAKIINNVESYAASILDNILNSYMKIVNFVVDFLLSLVIAFYMLRDKEIMSGWVLALFPFKWKRDLSDLGRDISQIAADFLQGQLLLAAIIGVLETIGLIIIGVKYPIIMGIIGGLSNLVPFLGPFIGAVPSIAVAFLDSPMKALWTVVLFVIVQQLDNNFIGPKIVEGKLGLHPVSTIIAVIIGGEFFGLTGIFLAVPVFAVLRSITRKIVRYITVREESLL